jgi:hypothetical protein
MISCLFDVPQMTAFLAADLVQKGALAHTFADN